MPLKDWGLGLEELTEYYHRYGLYYTDFAINKESQNWFITRGLVDQAFHNIKHWKSKKNFSVRSPMEIDLIGLRIDHKCKLREVRLIQCKEHVDFSMIQNIERSMLMPRIGGLTWEAEKQKILTKFVSYVTISSTAEEKLKNDRIGLLSFELMLEKLLRLVISLKKIGRKGFAREPTLWMIRSLMDKGFFDQKLVNKINLELSDN